jgi:N-acetyl-gamma-glutamyl-phosphate reductase
MNYVKKWSGERFKIVDLSGDFRLENASVYEQWYKKEHHFKNGFEEAVYGLPELHRLDIEKASLVANPGCYPTVSILTMLPLFAEIKTSKRISTIIDAKSGVTGAGAKAREINHYSNVNENFSAYGLKTHRHSIEIEEQLSGVANDSVSIQFTPHLLPVDRGILSTCYFPNVDNLSQDKIENIYIDFYTHEPFIRLRDEIPGIKDVRGTNYCDIYVTSDERTGNIIAVGVIDNLVKGAAGQAIQNMNIMLGMDESAGLRHVALRP